MRSWLRKFSVIAGTTASLLFLTSQTSALAQQLTAQQQSPSTPSQSQSDSPSINVSEQEIQSFANAFEAVQSIQEESRQEMAQAIEEEGLTIQQYNELFREEQQSGTTDAEGSQFSEEQQQQFEQADARIDEIEQEAQAQIEEAITNEGLEVERFEEIWMEVRKNPELQQQVQDILQS